MFSLHFPFQIKFTTPFVPGTVKTIGRLAHQRSVRISDFDFEGYLNEVVLITLSSHNKKPVVLEELPHTDVHSKLQLPVWRQYYLHSGELGIPCFVHMVFLIGRLSKLSTFLDFS
jgi:hypothetical protein